MPRSGSRRRRTHSGFGVAEGRGAVRVGKHPIPRRAGEPNVTEVTRHLFALERYDVTAGQSVPALTSLPPGEVRLVAAVHLPLDEVVLALVEGPDSDAVAHAAADAGWQVDRLCPAAWVVPQALPEGSQT